MRGINMINKLTSLSFDEGDNIERMVAWDKIHGIKPDFYICITKAVGTKCSRCWRYYKDTNYYEWADVCKRCNDVLNELFEREPERIRAL
jgi:hypothetical protein